MSVAVTLGGVVSLIVTVKVFDEWLPAASVAVTTTVVVPTANPDPDGIEYMIVGEAVTASVAVASGENVTGVSGAVASSVTLDGIVVITGAVVSFTVTVNDFVTALPRLSVAVTDTVVTPTGNDDPDATEYMIDATPLTGSDAVAADHDTGVNGPDASTEMFPGTDRLGGVVSWTVIVKEPVETLPWPSAAVTFTV